MENVIAYRENMVRGGDMQALKYFLLVAIGDTQKGGETSDLIFSWHVRIGEKPETRNTG